MRVCLHVYTDSPRLHAVLQSLQTGLDQVKGLEKQCGASPTEGATHEGFDSWVSLRAGVDTRREEHGVNEEGEDEQRKEQRK